MYNCDYSLSCKHMHNYNDLHKSNYNHNDTYKNKYKYRPNCIYDDNAALLYPTVPS